MKRILLIVMMLFSAAIAWAQEAGSQSKTFWDDPVNHPMMPLYVVALLMFIIVILVLLVAITLLNVIYTLTEKTAKERAEQLGVAYKPRPAALKRLWQRVNASVPVEEEKNIELDHNYDGIKELDNHLPPWWKWLFYGTIAWGLVYVVIYHYTDSLPLSEREYQNEVAQAEESKRKYIAVQPKEQIDESNLSYVHDQSIIQKGKEIYVINCSPCHKDNGAGGIGPNLTDEYWLHGGDVKNIYSVIKNGVPEKGMISWANVLSPQQIRDVSYFVLSINGTKPADGKAPQGELFKVQLPEIKKDTTSVQASL